MYNEVRYQALDVEMVQQRIIPFVFGEGTIDDLAAEVVRLERKRTFLRRCLQPVWNEIEHGKVDLPCWFDIELVRSCRPFFVGSNDPQIVAEVVERYRNARGKELFDILRDQVEQMNPALVGFLTRINPPGDTPPIALALEKALGDEYRSLAIFRSAGVAFRKGEEFRHPKWRSYGPLEVFREDFEDAVLEFNERLGPYWCSSIWSAEHLLRDSSDANISNLVAERRDVFAPLVERMPVLAEYFEERHYQEGMGAIVFAEKVPLVRADAERLLAAWPSDKPNPDNKHRSLRVLLEALRYAEKRGLTFTERITLS